MLWQDLSASKQREIDAENHIKHLAESELGRIKSDLSKAEKSLNELQDGVSFCVLFALVWVIFIAVFIHSFVYLLY